ENIAAHVPVCLQNFGKERTTSGVFSSSIDKASKKQSKFMRMILFGKYLFLVSNSQIREPKELACTKITPTAPQNAIVRYVRLSASDKLSFKILNTVILGFVIWNTGRCRNGADQLRV